jgi:hypothetical protein
LTQPAVTSAEPALRKEREALAGLLQKRAKIDSDALVLATTERDQLGRSSDYTTSQRRLSWDSRD